MDTEKKREIKSFILKWNKLSHDLLIRVFILISFFSFPPDLLEFECRVERENTENSARIASETKAII